jgi:hypothetical protein
LTPGTVKLWESPGRAGGLPRLIIQVLLCLSLLARAAIPNGQRLRLGWGGATAGAIDEDFPRAMGGVGLLIESEEKSTDAAGQTASWKGYTVLCRPPLHWQHTPLELR